MGQFARAASAVCFGAHHQLACRKAPRSGPLGPPTRLGPPLIGRRAPLLHARRSTSRLRHAVAALDCSVLGVRASVALLFPFLSFPFFAPPSPALPGFPAGPLPSSLPVIALLLPSSIRGFIPVIGHKPAHPSTAWPICWPRAAAVDPLPLSDPRFIAPSWGSVATKIGLSFFRLRGNLREMGESKSKMWQPKHVVM